MAYHRSLNRDIQLESLLPPDQNNPRRTRSHSTSSNRSPASSSGLLPSFYSPDTANPASTSSSRKRPNLEVDVALETTFTRALPEINSNAIGNTHTQAVQTDSRAQWTFKTLIHGVFSLLQSTSHRVVTLSGHNNPFKELQAFQQTNPLDFRDSSSGILEPLPEFRSLAQELNTSQADQSLGVRLARRILYNTWIEPLILILIVAQTALLVIDTVIFDTSKISHIFSGTLGWKEIIYVLIFIIYTLETTLKITLFWSEQRGTSTIFPPINLRNVFNMLDLISIFAFWIQFIRSLVGVPHDDRFAPILVTWSACRILRLLQVTPGTSSETRLIFETLKRSRNKLAKVASFIGFFWLVFAVIGVQSFKASLKRTCIVPDGDFVDINKVFRGQGQFCGGYLDAAGEASPWLTIGKSPGAVDNKGYLCPIGMVCQEGTNPYNGTVSFDNILQSLELVFVIFSANTFSILMYNILDSEGLVAALFFAAVIVILYFWLLILLIGIIMSSIQDVARALGIKVLAKYTEQKQSSKKPKCKTNESSEPAIRRAFIRFRWLWIIIIVFDLVAQSNRSASMSPNRTAFIDVSESVVTWILLFEISTRFILDLKDFHRKKQNLVDLVLAVITSIMQIPSFQKAGRVYKWFTGFQIARSYRVFWAIRPIRNMMMVSFSYFPALLQLFGFLFLLLFLASVLAAHLFRPLYTVDKPRQDIPFSDLWRSFLSMYQIFTGEDWTKSLYSVTQQSSSRKTAWIDAIFIVGWFITSSIIILNMFLSRIGDGLNIPEDEKRLVQIQKYLEENKNSTSAVDGAIESIDINEIARDFLGSDRRSSVMLEGIVSKTDTRLRIAFIERLRQFLDKIPIPPKLFSNTKLCHLPRQPLLRFRQICRIILGLDPAPFAYNPVFFKTFFQMTVISQIVITLTVTPVYERQYYSQHQFSLNTWFWWVDLAFAIIWSIEAAVKIAAAGLFRGPHAYFRGWNLIDALVLITSWISIILKLIGTSRMAAAMIASLKAFRVLRLLTWNKKVMKEVTLVFRRGTSRVLVSILVSLCLLIPFAIYGVNLFEGQAKFCNDTSLSVHNDCVGEFVHEDGPFYPAPRAVSRPYYAFDTFGQAFYTLFLIASQEGWTDVMYWAQGRANSSSASLTMNAMFFVLFNFCAAIFITALFASVMIQNYTEATGVAYLTRIQRSWVEQKRLLKHIRPTRRPVSLSPWRRWCYDLATRQNGPWQMFIVATFVLQLLVLCIDFYPSSGSWKYAQDIILATLTFIIVVNVAIRMIGITLSQFFRRPWDCFSFIILLAWLILSVYRFVNPKGARIAFVGRTLQTAILLCIIPYIPAFKELFNAALASISLVSTLLVIWFVFLLFFTIALTQVFGLTRFGPNENGNVNFRNTPKALILLFRMTLGEGRTKIMEDFAAIVPPFCTAGGRYLESDCGDSVQARVLFISWKVMSTYLFTSLFISLVYETFSYVYQSFVLRSGTLGAEDIRKFKEAWALVDSKRTGSIDSKSIPKLLDLISGQLGMRVYEDEFSIAVLQRECEHALPLRPGDIDLIKLNHRLDLLPIQVIQEKRRTKSQTNAQLCRLAEEMGGISLSTVLSTVIYYNMVDEREYLTFTEYVEQKKQLQEIDEELRVKSAVGWIKVYQCKKALRKLKQIADDEHQDDLMRPL